MPRVLVVAPTAGGDLPPLLALTEALDKRGHEVTAVGWDQPGVA